MIPVIRIFLPRVCFFSKSSNSKSFEQASGCSTRASILSRTNETNAETSSSPTRFSSNCRLLCNRAVIVSDALIPKPMWVCIKFRYCARYS
ncbi:unnamed protein product [Schistosoma margrebowiei]|uniref:Uncharacterized protein n=1 Tax=Schistosoma margrebowiei TaxID=48269 RepID=A0A3P7WKM1_9TREM|nr:unnamed protein product [Schistosoma margrebowiei]